MADWKGSIKSTFSLSSLCSPRLCGEISSMICSLRGRVNRLCLGSYLDRVVYCRRHCKMKMTTEMQKVKGRGDKIILLLTSLCVLPASAAIDFYSAFRLKGG